MSRIFITGSSDGLGSLAAQALSKKGHRVVLHARNAQRAKDAKAACPDAEDVLVGDLSSFSETRDLAAQANRLGTFDCVIHNAGIMTGSARNAEGIPALPAVNTFAPYILTALMNKPKRIVYVSSGMHYSGEEGKLGDWGRVGYADTKLHNVLLANAVAERWKGVESSSLDPGWVPTKLGGWGAPGDIGAGVATYVFLAEGGDGSSGGYFRDSRAKAPLKAALDKKLQERYMQLCEEVTGVAFPE